MNSPLGVETTGPRILYAENPPAIMKRAVMIVTIFFFIVNTQINKKPCLQDRVKEILSKLFYFLFESGLPGCKGTVLLPGVCWEAAGTDCPLTSCILSGTVLCDFEIKKTDPKHNRPIMPAKSQVPFSSTSVVCFTPINWLLKPAILPANPPPLGFCTNTINPSTTEANTIKITNNVVISVYFL